MRKKLSWTIAVLSAALILGCSSTRQSDHFAKGAFDFAASAIINGILDIEVGQEIRD